MMNKPPFTSDLNGFKTVKYAEVLTTFEHTPLTCEHVFASEDGCADIYTYSHNGEVVAIEFVQLLTVSEWWVKETAMTSKQPPKALHVPSAEEELELAKEVIRFLQEKRETQGVLVRKEILQIALMAVESSGEAYIPVKD